MSVVRPLARNQLCCTRRAYFHALSTHFFSTTPGKSSTSRSKTPRRHSHDVASSTSPKQTSPVNLFHESKLQAYLDSISESQDTLTLEDLTRLKPAKHSPALSPAYEAEYDQVLEKLQRSFTKGQLMYFLDLYPGAGKPGKYDRTKSGYAAHIIEQAWRWPAIGEVRKTKRDLSEVEIRSMSCFYFMIHGRLTYTKHFHWSLDNLSCYSGRVCFLYPLFSAFFDICGQMGRAFSLCPENTKFTSLFLPNLFH